MNPINANHDSSKPLFIPLRREFYNDFVTGKKREEYRVYGSRWNERTCAVGRAVVLSSGYGKKQRIKGLITSFRTDDHEIQRSPDWISCYGESPLVAACIGIRIDGMDNQAEMPPVLDACCGSRMFWFDRADRRALFVDKRREECSADTREGRRMIVVNPDVLADFKSLPFADATFSLVVFDPPHTFAGPNGWTAKKYGTLKGNWRDEIAAGFTECFRVLCPLGTLVFKWNEHRIPVSSVLELTPEKPLFGQRCGTTAKTHWLVFMKSN